MKDPLEFLNDVKIDLSEYDDTELNDIEKQKIKAKAKETIKNSRTKKPINLVAKASGFVALITICTLALGICFPTYAEKIPGLKNVVGFLNRNNEIGGYEENSVPVIESIKMDGYELNIENAYYNGIELTIFYNVVGDEPLDKLNQYSFEVNVDARKAAAYEYSLEYGDFIDDYTFAGMVSIYINYHDGSKLPEVFEGTIDFTKLLIGYDMSNVVDIDAEPINLSLDSRNMDIKEYPINKSIAFQGNSVEVLNAKEYPTGIFIEDKQTIVNEDISINYWVWDSNKGHLRGGAGRFTENGTMNFQYRLPSEDGEVFLVPYVYIYDSEDNTGINKVSIKLNESKYDLGNQGTFEILEIKDVEDTTEMKVRITGNQANSYFYFVGDEKEEHYRPIYEKEKKILGILDMEVTYVFNKLDRNINYYFDIPTSDFQLLDDQIIKVK